MLQVNNLSIRNLRDLKVLVKDLSFVVNSGDKIAIIGEEGAGKSSILKCILKDPAIQDYLEVEGSIKNSFATGYLPQNLDAYYDLSVRDYIGDINHSIIYGILDDLDLDYDFISRDTQIQKLSGGEKIKLALVKILMAEPDLLLLDEPSNDLDLATVYWLEDFIRHSDLAILFISHDTELLKATAEGIIHLGKISTFVPIAYEDFIDRRNRKYASDLMIANKQRADYKKRMERLQQIYQRVDHEQKVISRADPAGGRLLAKKMHAVKSTKRRFERETEKFIEIPEAEESILIKFSNYQPLPAAKPIINLVDYELKINENILVKNINLNFYGQDKIGIVGKNGVGKTTLFRMLTEELKNRTDIKLGVMPQDYREVLDYNQSAYDFLSVDGTKDERTKIMTYLSSVKFSKEEINRKMGELSPGQRAKIILTKLDFDGANVLLLDEPTRNFSPLSIDELNSVFADFKGAIFAISHDRSFLTQACDKIYELNPNGLKEI